MYKLTTSEATFYRIKNPNFVEIKPDLYHADGKVFRVLALSKVREGVHGKDSEFLPESIIDTWSDGEWEELAEGWDALVNEFGDEWTKESPSILIYWVFDDSPSML